MTDGDLAGTPALWNDARGKVASLSPRELEVLTLIAEGLSTREIGEALSISPRTVEIHRGKVMHKIDARTPGEAARIAVYAALATARSGLA